MAFDTVPFVIDGTTVDGEVIRRAIGSLIGVPGVIKGTDLAVSQQSTPNMSVQIVAGEIWVPGSSTGSQGAYYARNGAPVTVAIAAANPSDPRVDTVVVQVNDAAYAGTEKQLGPAVVTGTPTAGASLANLSGAGAVPASSMVLAYVLVPAGATSIVTADIENVAPQATPGLPALRTVPIASNYTARNRDAVQVVAGSGVQVTLPAPVAHSLIAVYANVADTLIIASSGVILGYGLGNSSTTMSLGIVGESVLLQADGSNWFVVANQRPNFRTVPTASDYTAQNLDIVEVVGTGAPLTITLPEPTAHHTVGVYTQIGDGSHQVTVLTPSGVILGEGLGASSTTVELGTPGAKLLLQADGSNWFVIAGAQNTGWLDIALASGVSGPSAGTAYEPQGRRKDDTGELRGYVQSTGASPSLGTLPSALWPAEPVRVDRVISAAGSLAPIRIGIDTAGNLAAFGLPPSTAFDLWLDGLTFSLS